MPLHSKGLTWFAVCCEKQIQGLFKHRTHNFQGPPN